MGGEDSVFPIHNGEKKLKTAKHNFEYYVRSLVPYHNNSDPCTKIPPILWNLSATAIPSFLISDPRQPCN